MPNEKKNKKIISGKQSVSAYTPYTRSYRVALEKADKTKRTKKD